MKGEKSVTLSGYRQNPLAPCGRGAVVGESIEPYKCGEGSNKNPQKSRHIADVAVGRFY